MENPKTPKPQNPIDMKRQKIKFRRFFFYVIVNFFRFNTWRFDIYGADY